MKNKIIAMFFALANFFLVISNAGTHCKKAVTNGEITNSVQNFEQQVLKSISAPGFSGKTYTKTGEYFSITYGLNTSGTFTLKIAKAPNSPLLGDGIYKWSLGYSNIAAANDSLVTTVKYLGKYDVYGWVSFSNGTYSGTAYHEVMYLDPIIEGVDSEVFYGTDLYVSGPEYYYLDYEDLHGYSQTVKTTCDYSGPYYHKLSYPGTYKIRATMNGNYSYEKSFQILAAVDGLEDSKVYIKNATFEVLTNEFPVFLDGTRIFKGTETVTEIGNHTLTITHGEVTDQIEFTVSPEIKNLSSYTAYLGSVSPIISGGDLFLDDEPYVSGSIISTPGAHIIKIEGENGYLLEIPFTVVLQDSGVKNGDVFTKPVKYVYSGGLATLDGQPYTSGTEITEIGNHTIIITGSNGFTKTINFCIPYIINFDLKVQSYFTSFTPEFVSLFATLDGVDYISGTQVNDVGNHTLFLSGYGRSLQYSFAIVPTVENVQNNGAYRNSVTPIVSGGTLELDGQPYISGTAVTDPGSHTLVISGVNGYTQSINFTIGLSDFGITDGDNFVDAASYTFSGGTASLDGQPYTSGTEITEIGNHTIVVSGSTGFEKTINFTIEPSVSEISNGASYSRSVTPVISGGSLTLDGAPYISGTAVTDPGGHTLVISGVNGYTQTIIFSIVLVDSGISNGNFFIDSASYTFSGGSATLDGKPYTSGSKITEIGNHTIVVSGSTGFEKTINFTIGPSVSGISNGASYSGSVTPFISGGTLTLDGQAYVSGASINVPGTHTIRITGSNGYSKDITFNIGLVDGGLTDGGVYYNSTSYTFSGGSATLDGKPYASGTEIIEIGNHTIEIEGSNGYKKTIHFRIKAIDYYIKSSDCSWQIWFFNIHPDTIVSLDGVAVYGHYEETRIGNHTLTITNKNGYSETVNFTVKEKASFKNGETFDNPFIIDGIEGDIYVDGVKVNNGYRIDVHGTHEIKIIGTNGYVAVYHITYNNPNNTTALYFIVPMVASFAAAGFMFYRRRRMK